MSDRVIWRDGEFIPWDEAAVHVMSHSLQRGTLAFDYLGIHETPGGPALFRLPEHIDRLVNTCRLVGLPLAHGRNELIRAVVDTARSNPGSTAVKISVLVPSIEVEIVPQDFRTAVYIAAYDNLRDVIQPNRGAYHRSSVLKLKIETARRNRRADFMPAQAKVSANYAFALAAKVAARNAGYDDILLLDEDNQVAEAPTSNIFLVDGTDSLCTPPLDRILNGITRDSVIEIARYLGMDVSERHLLAEDLFEAKEAFVTASTLGLATVGEIDGHTIGTGNRGPVTERLSDCLKAATQGEIPEFEHWLLKLA